MPLNSDWYSGQRVGKSCHFQKSAAYIIIMNGWRHDTVCNEFLGTTAIWKHDGSLNLTKVAQKWTHYSNRALDRPHHAIPGIEVRPYGKSASLSNVL